MTDEQASAGDGNGAVARIDAVSHRFGELDVLTDVSFALTPGSVTSLVGPNGSGKTTLLRIVAGLLAPTGGRVERPDRPRPVGYLPQHPDFRPTFTVEETLGFYAGLLADHADVAAVLERVGLLAARERRVEALSGGMRRLLGIAQAILGEPPVVLFDEPTGDLDPGMTEHIMGVVEGLAGPETAVLMATHDLTGAARGDALMVLDRGRIVAEGPPDAVIEGAEAESLAEAYRSLVEGEQHAISPGQEPP